MITGFAIHGCGREALDLFSAMEKSGLKPNVITFTGVLTACSYSGLVDEGKFVFEKMKRVYSIAPTIVVDLLG
ncbi:hypothetical protein GIB67_005554 [Kingdonia uniflora]|uniref:Pentatricopeptide repeat-containing protein n=1 Tax=Kingdonia uniflora TaxID=39325 RepID=A0A7J7M2G9_9MAGN|nr:hypothetical protein GIB67_042441 [Kingdonia uniflora]KAF6166692.1 hypothetical protein GIB67_005554 [Kingdonia uniflora]